MEQLSRRQFAITAAATCACMALSGPSAFAAAPAQPVEVGAAGDFKKDGANGQWARTHGFMLIRRDKRIYAVSALCTHSGKSILNPGEPGLRCPKHGSQFDLGGAVVRGPAKRALARFAIRVDDKGKIIVDPSQLFEQGQWDDAAAFVAVE